MEDQVENSGLLKMPVLVLERILSNIHNLSSVLITCKCLYSIVCGMEKHRRVMYIEAIFDATARSTHLTIEDDAVFDSVMNSLRPIKEINIHAKSWDAELNERQLERVTAIMKQFGANITSFKLSGFTLSINTILRLLHQVPKLESLAFAHGTAMGSAKEKTTMSLQLSYLRSLTIKNCYGLLDIVKLIPAGSLNHCSYSFYSDNQSTEILNHILTKQHNIKSLTLDDNYEPTVLLVTHLQLETLILKTDTYSNEEVLEILQCHTNLKELRLPAFELSGLSFKWICNNLKNLEVLEVEVHPRHLEKNVFEMLENLQKLRHLRTNGSLFNREFQCTSNSFEKLKITDSKRFCNGDVLHKIVNSMVRSFTNLRDLEMNFEEFSALNFVLIHCTSLIRSSNSIGHPSSNQLTEQRFPNIQHLTLSTSAAQCVQRFEMCQSMSLIVKAMPNLKRLSMHQCSIIFNVNLMKDFINGSKSLDYLYVNCFELGSNVSADDFVESIRCLLDPLKAYQITFVNTLREKLDWHKVKDILSKQFNVRNVEGIPSAFCLLRGSLKKFQNNY